MPGRDDPGGNAGRIDGGFEGPLADSELAPGPWHRHPRASRRGGGSIAERVAGGCRRGQCSCGPPEHADRGGDVTHGGRSPCRRHERGPLCPGHGVAGSHVQDARAASPGVTAPALHQRACLPATQCPPKTGLAWPVRAVTVFPPPTRARRASSARGSAATSRRPSVFTPTASTHALVTIRPVSRAFT